MFNFETNWALDFRSLLASQLMGTISSNDRQSRPVSEPKSDAAAFLVAYDVITDLDRADNSSWWGAAWWQSGLDSLKQLSRRSKATDDKPGQLQITAPTTAGLLLSAAAAESTEAKTKQRRVAQSSILVWTVVVLTASITFALVRFGWHSLVAVGGLIKF